MKRMQMLGVVLTIDKDSVLHFHVLSPVYLGCTR